MKSKFSTEKPLVSIIIPTYNREELLKLTIESALNQTYDNFEIIVVNDFGEDVWDLISSFENNKITYNS